LQYIQDRKNSVNERLRELMESAVESNLARKELIKKLPGKMYVNDKEQGAFYNTQNLFSKKPN
jgi:hypothetical protein